MRRCLTLLVMTQRPHHLPSTAAALCATASGKKSLLFSRFYRVEHTRSVCYSLINREQIFYYRAPRMKGALTMSSGQNTSTVSKKPVRKNRGASPVTPMHSSMASTPKISRLPNAGALKPLKVSSLGMKLPCCVF